MVTCAACGQENPEGFKFCGACGAPLVAPEPAPEEERKIVTALFTDIVGSTATAEKLDPEDVHARLQPYYARVRHELVSFGGTVEKFIGDAVVAVFGAPVAHEDDPERAVRAALAIRRAVTKLNEEDAWLDLHLRTAVHTGEALVVVGARAVEGEGFAAGDVMNTAARIQGGAAIDGIVVGEATYRATWHAFEYREAEPVVAKGKAEPIPIWEVVGEKTISSRPKPWRRLVGREQEIGELWAAWERTGEGRSQLVTVLGAPGIGKSRLLVELSNRVPEDVAMHWGRCLSYGEGITYWPLTEIVRDAAGIASDDDSESAARKLGALLERLPTQDSDQLRTIAAALSNLLGAATTPEGTYSAEQIGQSELHWGIRRFFELLSSEGPLLLVLEDLHWAEPTLLELVRGLLECDGPLLVVGTARPELGDEHPDFARPLERRHVIQVEPLGADHSLALAEELVGDSGVDPSRLSAVLSKAGGNPLFVEETIRMLADSGLLHEGVDLESLAVPESLQTLIGSRLDALPIGEKSVAQQSSVVGTYFWRGAVAHLALTSDGLDGRLDELERRDVIHHREESSIAGDREYQFEHILIRDVAYDRLPRGRRAELHVRFVDWLHGISEAAEDEFVEVAAYHLEQSCLLARGLARSPIEAPVAAAAEALARAGVRAERRGGMREADRYFARALELIDDQLSHDALELRVRRAYTQNVLGEVNRAVEELSAVAAVAADAATADHRPVRGAALALLGQIDLRQGRVGDARAHLTEAGEIAAETEDTLLQVRTMFRLAALWGDYDGDLERAVEEMSRALDLAQELDDRALQVEGHLRLAFLLVNKGELARAEEALERCLATAAETGSVRDDAQATYLLGLVKHYRGEAEEAERLGLQARDWLERSGETYMGVQNLIALARYALERDEPGEAERHMQAAVPLALDGGGWLVVSVYRYLALAFLGQDRLEEAAELIEFAGQNVPEEDALRAGRGSPDGGRARSGPERCSDLASPLRGGNRSPRGPAARARDRGRQGRAGRRLAPARRSGARCNRARDSACAVLHDGRARRAGVGREAAWPGDERGGRRRRPPRFLCRASGLGGDGDGHRRRAPRRDGAEGAAHDACLVRAALRCGVEGDALGQLVEQRDRVGRVRPDVSHGDRVSQLLAGLDRVGRVLDRDREIRGGRVYLLLDHDRRGRPRWRDRVPSFESGSAGLVEVGPRSRCHGDVEAQADAPVRRDLEVVPRERVFSDIGVVGRRACGRSGHVAEPGRKHVEDRRQTERRRRRVADRDRVAVRPALLADLLVGRLGRGQHRGARLASALACRAQHQGIYEDSGIEGVVALVEDGQVQAVLTLVDRRRGGQQRRRAVVGRTGRGRGRHARRYRRHRRR